jgi:hypothetical protein
MNVVNEDFRSALDSDLQKFMLIQTEGICDCNEYCHREGVCRSFQITTIDIQSVDILSIANFIWEKSNDTKTKSFYRQDKIRMLFDGVDKRIDIYCLERILTINKIWKTENWDWNYINGYYGHEIDAVKINEHIADEINLQVQECNKLTNLKDKIEYLLKLEYGYVLDTLKDCNYQIQEVDKNLIFFPQKSHFKKVKKKTNYKNRQKDNIMGLCLLEDGSYRVIDGYNRLSQSRSKSVTIINAFK